MMKPQITSSSDKIKFIAFHLSFSLIGFTLAIWFGLGWLVLFQTIRLVIFHIPQLYFPIIRLLISEEFMIQEITRKRGRESPSFLTIIGLSLSLALTVLFFWKINLSLLEILRWFTIQ